MSDAIEHMKRRRAEADYRPPHADLGYCRCGTVWNMGMMEQAKMPRDECPDCYRTYDAIKRADGTAEIAGEPVGRG